MTNILLSFVGALVSSVKSRRELVAGSLACLDFFVVPTATFGLLFGLVVLLHQRRPVVHFNATANPTAQRTAQQIAEAFPEDTAPSTMICDRDRFYGADFVARIEGMGIGVANDLLRIISQ